jgi:hypothetical protein
VNTFYSAPSQYLAAKRSAAALSFPLKTDDFFPYCGNTGGSDYWTGYFTSRPTLKAQDVPACVESRGFIMEHTSCVAVHRHILLFLMQFDVGHDQP